MYVELCFWPGDLDSGTLGYAAPELTGAGKSELVSITQKCDVFSFGVLLATLYDGQLVWDSADADAVLSAPAKGSRRHRVR